MIRRLQIRGYKSILDATAQFEPLTVILGPNGVGKSNLFDLIDLLSRLVSRESIREAFAGHRGRPLEAFHSKLGFGSNAYSEILKQKTLSFGVVCDIELNHAIVKNINEELQHREKVANANVPYTRVTERLLRYTLELALDTSSGELFVTDERLQALKPKNFELKLNREPFISKEESSTGRSRFVARVERQGHPRYFEMHRPRTLLSELSDIVYHPHVVAAAREIASWRVYYIEPSKVRAEVGVQAAEEPGRNGELLAPYLYFLKNKQPPTFAGLVKAISEFVPDIKDLNVNINSGLLEIIAVRSDGSQFPARLLSEGTLRVLVLIGIAVAPSPPSVVFYEEPENGINPARLDTIAQVVRNAVHGRDDGPQFIVTTHSPLVCKVLGDHLVLSKWSAMDGTKFEQFRIKRDGLFFENEVVRYLEEVSPVG